MIGAETGKIIGYSVRSKFCKTCDEANRKGTKAKMHDCRLNWDGSSKAMEQDMVVEMVWKLWVDIHLVTTLFVIKHGVHTLKIHQRNMHLCRLESH